MAKKPNGGCCGRRNINPTITPDQKKIIDNIKKSSNFGAIKRGSRGVTAYSKQCFNCNTLSSNVSVCPICGYKL